MSNNYMHHFLDLNTFRTKGFGMDDTISPYKLSLDRSISDLFFNQINSSARFSDHRARAPPVVAQKDYPGLSFRKL